MGKLNLRLARLAEFALCTAIASSLVYVVQGGFNIDEGLHGNVGLIVVVCAALMAFLFIEVAKPALKVGTRIGYAVLSIAVCVAAVMMSPTGNPINDVPENPFVAVVIFVTVCALVFALSRRGVTAAILFGLGGFTCGYIQFLYVMNMLVATAVFLVASVALLVCRSYLDSANRMGSVPPTVGLQSCGMAVLLSAGALVLAAVVVLAVVMPLNPPHATITLFTQELAYQTEYVQSAVSLSEDADIVVTSSNVDESLEPRTTTDRQVEEDSPPVAEEAETEPQEREDYLSSTYSDVDLSGVLAGAQALALNPMIPWPLIILGIILIIALLLTLPRYLVHRLRLRRFAGQAPSEQITGFYRFFLGRFAKLGLGKPETLSPVEYANLYRAKLYPYVGAQEPASFDHLTALFVMQEFGAEAVDQEDIRAIHHLYRQFYRNCRRQLGLLKYGLRYITL